MRYMPTGLAQKTADRLERHGYLIVAALAVISSLTVLANDFSYDDIPVIRDNDRVHSLANLWEVFTEPYWPPPYAGLYRPVSTLVFAVEWAVSGGAPWFLHAMSIVLYAVAAAAVFIVARRLLPLGAAAFAGAAFAVHPLHTESVAQIVNQSEILVALLLMLGVWIFLAGRLQGAITTGRGWVLVGIYVVACLTKEHGIVLPVLLVCAELTVVRDPAPVVMRLRRHLALGLGFALAGLLFIVVRARVLDDPIGSFTAEALRGASLGDRALTMLAVVPRAIQLLLWPSELQMDYSPQEIVGAAGWGPGQWIGTAALGAGITLLVLSWRQRPVFAFGLLWAAVAVLPVSNIIVPTGVVLAERTLFLASVGVVFAAGDVAALVRERRHAVRPLFRLAGAAAVGVSLLLGVAKSLSRHPVWKNQLTLFRQSVVDAPLGYKAHWGFANVLVELEQVPLAEARYRIAIELYPTEPRLLQRLGDLYRNAGICGPAIPLYVEALALRPEFWGIRASLVGCLTHLGRYREARAHAIMGVARRENVTNFQYFVTVIDSARAASAPPGSVMLQGVEPIPELEIPEP